MHIRPLTAEDVPAAAALLSQLGYAVDSAEIAERIARVGAAPGYHTVVAELDGRAVGLLHVYERAALEKPAEAVVQALVVDEASRETGVGRALMREAEDWARARGLASVSLYTRVDRDNARAFYASLGYEIAATAHLMRKPLEA
jgi:ribosomal protein S18 acetylase RimI-like enzyme